MEVSKLTDAHASIAIVTSEIAEGRKAEENELTLGLFCMLIWFFNYQKYTM